MRCQRPEHISACLARNHIKRYNGATGARDMIILDYQMNHILKRAGCDQRVENGQDMKMKIWLEVFDCLVDRIEALEAKLAEQSQ
jgi:hypothetical protein